MLFLFCEPKVERTFVFIDSAYLSEIAKHLLETRYPHYDLNKFALNLTKEQNLSCSGIFYYTAPPYQSSQPSTKEKRKKAKYDKFISRLRSIANFIVREGRCQKTDDGYQQKGVDTLLTMDLMDVCARENVKKIILIACDTDFVPILNKIREDYSVEFVLYYFTDRVRRSKFSMSNHILTACDRCILITKQRFIQCLLKKRE